MRVLVLAPSWATTPPAGHGPAEQHSAYLAGELSERGHEVTVFATGDSNPGCDLAWRFPRAGVEPHGQRERMHVEAALRFAEEEAFDVVHSNESNLGLLLIGRSAIPSVTRMNWPGTPELQTAFEELPQGQQLRTRVCSVSDSLGRQVPYLRPRAAIPNGIDVGSYPANGSHTGPLLFVGRVCPDKGAHIAAQIALAAGHELTLAGPVTDRAYFDSELQPLLRNSLVNYIGPVDANEKRSLYAQARALLMPYQWEEPFGNVLIEAMACGTPCVAFDRGSPREVVVPGKTGFIVKSADEAVAAIGSLASLRADWCRQHVETNFSIAAMADAYFKQYLAAVKAF